MQSIFHLAFHVRDLDAARRFYGNVEDALHGFGLWAAVL